MKILFISHKYPPATGGMEKFSFELVSYFEKTNHQILTLIYKGSGSKLFWFLRLKKRCRKLLAEHPDIDWIHFNDGLMATACRWIRKEFYGKMAVTIHGLDIVFPLPYYQQKIIPTFQTLDAIICVSEATRKACLQRGLSEEKLFTVFNGIEHKQQELSISSEEIYHQLNILKEKKIIIGLGRPVRRKGYSWFVREVLPKLSDEFVFVLCGPKSTYNARNYFWLPSFLRRYLELALGLGTDEEALHQLEKTYSIRFIRTGYLPTSEITALFQSSSVFVMPNIRDEGDMEGFGLVALEAVMRGTVVLASNLEGITDAIVDGKNGYLIPPGEANPWVDAIQNLVYSDEIIEKKRDFLQYTKDNYSWDKMGAGYERLFNRLLEYITTSL